MRSTTYLAVLAATIAVAQASYEIKLYSHSFCLITAGKKCTDLKVGDCCSDGTEYKSAKVSGGSSDAYLTLYEDQCTGDVVKMKTDSGCATLSSKTLRGAQVYADGNSKREIGLGSLAGRVVEPDEAFLEEGDYVYTIKRNSTTGDAYERLTRMEDQIDHLRIFGKRESLNKAR